MVANRISLASQSWIFYEFFFNMESEFWSREIDSQVRMVYNLVLLTMDHLYMVSCFSKDRGPQHDIKLRVGEKENVL